jgi:hypothetical protein
VNASDARIMRALGRTLRVWSLIKLIPVRELLPLQPPLLKLLSARPASTEDEMVALGLKHLYSSDVDLREISGEVLSTSSMITLLMQSTQQRPNRSDAFAGRSRSRGAYQVIAASEWTKVSMKRRSLNDAIATAQVYHRLGATVVIEAPDGKRYSLERGNALRST